jgi:hypothetical protein
VSDKRKHDFRGTKQIAKDQLDTEFEKLLSQKKLPSQEGESFLSQTCPLTLLKRKHSLGQKAGVWTFAGSS